MKPYYQDSACTIYHGDSESLLCDLTADIILTDPPYGVGVQYGAFDDNREDYWEWMRRMVDLMRASAKTVAFTHRVAALHQIHGWDWIGVWAKPYAAGSRIGNSCILPHWEPIFMFGIHGLGVKSVYGSDVYEFSPAKAGLGGSKIGREKWAQGEVQSHPVPKPQPLYGELIRTLGQTAECILDPFCGSGTTLRAAKDMGKKAIGIEIEERYCEIAANRLSQEVLPLS